MSGLYNVVFGESGIGHELVGLLNSVQPISVGRYRDGWVEAAGDTIVIAVYTRNGGGNRDDYDAEIGSMLSHPWFLSDDDDDFDSTYATFRFLVPDRMDGVVGWEKVVATLSSVAQPQVDTSQRWLDMIERLRKS